MIKKGTRVRIESGGKERCGGYDGRIGIVLDEPNSIYDMVGIKLDIGNIDIFEEEHLTPVEPSIDNLMVGDVVGHENYQTTIKFIGNDDCIFTSNKVWHSKKDFKDSQMRVISPSPKTTLTKKEIAAKFGIEEDNMEIR